MLHFRRILTLDIFDYSGRKICPLYDSRSDISGQATDVFVIGERNGWKELHFNLQSVVDTEDGKKKNFRLDYLKADYCIRAVDENETDWFLISEPKITHSGFSQNVEVIAGHVSMLLKQKNLTLIFNDDEGNNVGTPAEFLDVILQGTNWYPGNVTTFYEDNGDIKRRSLSCDENTGSFKMISDMCELFDAKPVYHGESYVPLASDPGDMDTRFKSYCTLNSHGEYVQLTEPATFDPDMYYRYKVRSVDILPMNPFSVRKAGDLPNIYKTNTLIDSENVIELHYGKALKNVTRTLNTENIVTKLFAYGSYGDKVDGYCSIGECEHTEFTYLTTVSIPVGAYGLFYYSDDAGDHHGRFLVSGKPVDVGDTLIYSLMDPASRMYIYNLTKGYAYYVDEDYGGTLVNEDGQPDLTSEETNMANFIMDFTYYYNVGLFTEEMLQELARNQRESPALREAASAASAAFNDKESLISETIGNTDYCKIMPLTYESGEGGYLKIRLNPEYPKGVQYRTDYYERDVNQFQWYCASELKSNGDSKNDNASVVYLIHDTDPVTWDKTYVKTINDIPLYKNRTGYDIGDQVLYSGSFYECITATAGDEAWTSSNWKLITNLEPETITLWERFADHPSINNDELFLFKSNTVNGVLGAYESADESAVLKIIDAGNVNGSKHKTFFQTIDETNNSVPTIQPTEINEYAWCWVYDPVGSSGQENDPTDIGWHGRNTNGHIMSTMWFYNQTNVNGGVQDLPAGRWCPVYFTDDAEPVPYPYSYWYDWRNGKAYYAKEIPAEEAQYDEIEFKTIKYIYDQHEFEVWSDLVQTYSANNVVLMSEEDKNNHLISIYPSYVENETKLIVKSEARDAYYAWEQFNTNDKASKVQERIGLCFGTLWNLCRQRDRYYQGDYQIYRFTAEEELPAGRYAFRTPYGAYCLMTTDHGMAAGDTMSLDTTDRYITQVIATGTDAGEHTVEISAADFDNVSYHPTNVLTGISFEEGSLDATKATDILQEGSYRSAFAKVYGGLTYTYDGPEAIVYIYNSKKVYQNAFYNVGGSYQNTFPVNLALGDTGLIRVVTEDENTDDIRIYYGGYKNAIISNEETYTLIPFIGDTTSDLKSIPSYVKIMRDYSDDLYLNLFQLKKEAQDAVTKLDADFANALGDIHREGYWQDSNYVDGDENRLYTDALENLQHIAKPEATYDIEFLDPYGSNEHVDLQADDTLPVPWPDLNISYAVHLVDPEIGINEWAFIDRIEKCYDKPWETTLEVNTNLTTIAQHSFADVLENIANVASQLNGKQSKYDRAVIGGGANGTVAAQLLEGQIDLDRLSITGAASTVSTDSRGAMVFEEASGDAAMMLTGSGFAIANSKNADGDWNWRTFGTGRGFTADMITTGYLSAERIQAGSITVDKIENGLGAAIDLSNNSIVMSVQANKYDKFNGVIIDEDGVRLTTGMNGYGGFMPLAEEPEDWSSNYGNYYRYNESTGEYSRLTEPAAFETNLYYKAATGGENLVALGKDGISLAAGSSIELAAGAGVHIQTGASFTVDSGNFNVTDDGNVAITGVINATGGSITGNLTTTGNGSFDGKITARQGQIGGFAIDNNMLYHQEAEPNDNRSIYLDGTGSPYAIWAGSNTAEKTVGGETTYAPFVVTKAGVLRADGAIISGDISATTGHVGGYEIAGGILSTGTGTSFVALDGSDSNYAFWAGDETAEDAPFYVTKAGALYASDVDITGNINATTGTIGGWTIDSDGLMRAGASGTYVALDPRSSTNYAFWAGSETPTAAKFRVDKDGTLHATGADISGPISVQAGGTIGGFTIRDSSLYTGTKASPSAGAGVYIGTDGIGLGTAFSVTAAGAMTATSGYIGGWTIGNGYLYSGSGSNHVRLDSTANASYAIWAGAESPAWATTGGLPMYAPFCVTTTGVLHARNADISGTINATSGQIGQWSIGADGSLSGTYFVSDMATGDVNYSIVLNPVPEDGGDVIKVTRSGASVFGISDRGEISPLTIKSNYNVDTSSSYDYLADIFVGDPGDSTIKPPVLRFRRSKSTKKWALVAIWNYGTSSASSSPIVSQS